MTKKKSKRTAVIAKRKLDVCVVYGDMHDPFCDEPVFQMFLMALGMIRPNILVENGDGLDFYQLSSFSKDPVRRLQLSNDRLIFVQHRMRILEMVGKKCRKIYLAGNHEARLQRFMSDKAPEFTGLSEFDPERFLQLDIMGWEYMANFGKRLPELQLGNLTVTHGHIARKHSAYSAHAMQDELGCSVLCNHTHRLGSYWKTDSSTTHSAFENGHLYDPTKVDYESGAVNWQQGFSVVMVDRETGWFRVEQIPIVRVPNTNIKRMFLHEGIVEAVCA